MKTITRFLKDDTGADLVEYALLVGLVALAAIGTLGGVASSIMALFTEIQTQIDTALP
jgi:Flp pilus assembly pilin Flp